MFLNIHNGNKSVILSTSVEEKGTVLFKVFFFFSFIIGLHLPESSCLSLVFSQGLMIQFITTYWNIVNKVIVSPAHVCCVYTWERCLLLAVILNLSVWRPRRQLSPTRPQRTLSNWHCFKHRAKSVTCVRYTWPAVDNRCFWRSIQCNIGMYCHTETIQFLYYHPSVMIWFPMHPCVYLAAIIRFYTLSLSKNNFFIYLFV